MNALSLMHTIRQQIESNRPVFIGRIAGVELQTAYHLVHGKHAELPGNIAELENNAGIRVASQASLQQYVDRLLAAYDHCTAIAEWEQQGQVFAITGKGQQLIARRTPSIPKFPARALEPYYAFLEPADTWSWMPALKGKRILVIHPFQATIQAQLPHLPTLFEGHPEWLEGCTIQVIKPPVTLAGNHENKDWQDHYQAFIADLQTSVQEFDVALVAAGGYGMLIADEIYTRMNKSVIYVGGALQLFFGIIGKRWFDQPDVMKLVTDDWVRPAASDKPPQAVRVEKGCYW